MLILTIIRISTIMFDTDDAFVVPIDAGHNIKLMTAHPTTECSESKY